MEREEIIELWMQLRYGHEQQESFTPFYDDSFTEENLTAHENEVARLKQEREEAAHILEIVARYETRLHAIEELEKSTHSADRFNTRGDPGRLLREEKERKQNARELPKLEAELTEALNRWQEEKGHHFLIYGEEYIHTMQAAAQLAREGKENEKRDRVRSCQSVCFNTMFILRLNHKETNACFSNFSGGKEKQGIVWIQELEKDWTSVSQPSTHISKPGASRGKLWKAIAAIRI